MGSKDHCVWFKLIMWNGWCMKQVWARSGQLKRQVWKRWYYFSAHWHYRQNLTAASKPLKLTILVWHLRYI